ncbi:hypothetical protein GGI17_000254 [Coemansia sp. S146]|nr:hypothetical protein GGI17_000254 [Coemansia sp. S146]
MPYDGCTFPQARKFTFALVTECGYAKDDGCLPPDTEANILAFTQRIKGMAPRVNKVFLGIADKDGELVTSSGKHMRSLLSNLSKLTNVTLLTNGYRQLMACLDLLPVCKLTCINFEIRSDASQILQLARLTAQTLQTISIWSHYGADISGLIRGDANDECVEYPCLHTLTMLFNNGSNIRQGSSFKDAVPFPNLQRLAMYLSYPFSDDVAFRGNATTLEYLKLDLTDELVALLANHNVLTRISHPKLKCVNTGWHIYQPLSPFMTAAAYLKFALSIVPDASTRVIDYWFERTKAPPSVLSILGDYASIQVLVLPRVRLSFWEAISLIKALPLLSDLRTCVPTLGEIPQGVTDADLPEYARLAYAPMDKRFQCWHIASHSEYGRVELVTFMLLLALICPNLDYTAVYKNCRESFMKEMRKQIDEPRFREYAPRLSRLLDIN